MNKKKIVGTCLAATLCCALAGAALFLPLRPAYADLAKIKDTDYTITSDTSFRVSPDVVERNLVMNTESGTQTLGYVMDIKADRKNVKFRASYGNLDETKTNTWTFKALSDQMKEYQTKYPDERVIAGVNSDIFNMTTGEPTGMLVIRGKKFHENKDRAYFASFSDGSVGIFEAGTTIEQAEQKQREKTKNPNITIEDASGGFFTLAMDGKLTSGADTDASLVPRTAIGIKEDGSVVILCVDGRQAPRSSGLTTREVAYTMLHLGCKDVLNFDGGGSTTFSTHREGENEAVMRNIPSDGFERTISSALLITTTAQPSGQFDHASITPQNEYYTPGSAVELSALASDAYGFAVDQIPQGEWKVKDANGAEKGTFTDSSLSGNTAKATFTAPENFVGDLTVEYVVGGQSKGETTLGFYHPDTLSFPSESVNLDYKQETDFGLTAFYNQKIVHLKPGDIQWEEKFEELRVSGVGTLYPHEEKKTKEQYFGHGETYTEAEDKSYAEYEKVYEHYTEEYNEWQKDKNRYATGTFEGLKFTVTENWKISSNATVTATYQGEENKQEKVSKSIYVKIGMQPSLVINGGDEGEAEVADKNNTSFHAIDYAKFGRVSLEGGKIIKWDNESEGESADTVDLVTAHYVETNGADRGGQESAEVVSTDKQEWAEIVRFGKKAIKLNYDFSQSENKIEGACIGFSRPQVLTGSPTAIGLWLYAPEGTVNLWLRAAIGVQNVGSEDYTYQYVNFTDACNAAQAKDKTDFGGINWEGWKYVEADLSGFAGRAIKILPGELVRLMYATGTYQNGLYDRHGTPIPTKDCKGWVLIDNVQFVYGTNTQDVVAPVTGGIRYSLTGGSDPQPLEDGMTIPSNTVTFRTSAADDTAVSPYNSGMSEACYYYIDGKLFREKAFQTDGDYCYTVSLPDGEHSVRFYAKDNFGNVSDETVYFSVSGGGDGPRLRLEYDDFAGIGNYFRFKLYAFGAVKQADLTLSLNGKYEIETICADHVTKKSEKDGVWSFAIDGGLDNGLVATLKLKIPVNVFAGSLLSFQASGSFETDAEQGTEEIETVNTFRMRTIYSPIREFYHLRAQDMIVNMGDGEIYIFDTENDPADEIDVYYVQEADGEENAESKEIKLGKTDKDGKLIREEGEAKNVLLTAEQGTYTLYAIDEYGARSFYTAVTSYNAVQYDGEGDPPVAYYAIFNAVSDPSTQKNISWMSYIKDLNEASKANKLELSESEDMKDAVLYTGTSTIVSYDTQKNANYVNNLALTSLKPGTEYYYRVGDGENWSEPSSFTTTDSLIKRTEFFVVGDMQGEDAAMASKFSESMEKAGHRYLFGIQTGDSVDNPGSYDEWTALLNVLSNNVYAKTPMIHVIGNHETVNDPTAFAARKIYGSTAEGPSGWTSYEIGDVYVASLGFTTDAEELKNFAEWLKEDAGKSRATWKILTCHVPIFNTNPEQSESEIYRRAGLEQAIEEAGVKFVFSGHDHSYARTKVLKGGAESEDGVVYFIAGTAGDKKYSCVSSDKFEKATQDYHALYLSVSANSRHIEITAWDVDENGTATQFDFYEAGPRECQLADHQFEYNSETGDFFCKVCGNYYKIDDLKLYSGLVDDTVSGSARYLQGGKFLTGAVNIDGVWHYFDENCLGLNGTLKLGGDTFLEDCVFEKGAFVPGGKVTDAGLAGDEAYFLILEGKTFYLTGSGKTYSFSSESGRPWGVLTDITEIVVGKDITEIGNVALRNIPKVTSLTFEKGSKLEVIGQDSLRDLGKDTNIELIVLPQSVKTIKIDAFRGIRVGTLVLPDGVEPFERDAFRWYFKLELNVLEGSKAHTTAESLGLPFKTRSYLMSDGADDMFTGVVVTENQDKTEREIYYVVDGELAKSREERFAAISETVKRYQALSGEEKSARAEEFAILKGLTEEYNGDAKERNEVQERVSEAAFGPFAAAAAVAVSAVAALAGAVLKRRFW